MFVYFIDPLTAVLMYLIVFTVFFVVLMLPCILISSLSEISTLSPRKYGVTHSVIMLKPATWLIILIGIACFAGSILTKAGQDGIMCSIV